MKWVWLIAFASACIAQECLTIAWDENAEPDLAGYLVYYGPQSRNYTNVVQAGLSTSNTICGLVPGVTYFFAVTAYNTNGLESDFSVELSYATSSNEKPSEVVGLGIGIKTWR